jgi:hypothetical protein
VGGSHSIENEFAFPFPETARWRIRTRCVETRLSRNTRPSICKLLAWTNFSLAPARGYLWPRLLEISYKTFPTLQGLQDELPSPIFGMYLDATDDYTAEENPEQTTSYI